MNASWLKNVDVHTALWWSKVLSWGWSAWAGAASFLDAQGAALNDLSLKTLLGSIGLLAGDHLDEAEATGLLGMWVKHDLALLNLTVLLKETGDLSLGETWVDTSNEEVGSWVDGAIVLATGWWSTFVLWSTWWAC